MNWIWTDLCEFVEKSEQNQIENLKWISNFFSVMNVWYSITFCSALDFSGNVRHSEQGFSVQTTFFETLKINGMCALSKQKIATLFRVILVKKPFLPSSITLGKNWFCIAWWCCKNTVAWNVSHQFHGKSENYWVTGIFNKRLRWVLQKNVGSFFYDSVCGNNWWPPTGSKDRQGTFFPRIYSALKQNAA